MRKKVLSLLLIACMIGTTVGCGSSGSSSADASNPVETTEEAKKEESIYPTKIDLSQLYTDEDAFLADCDQVIKGAEEIAKKYKGKLNNKEAIIHYFNDLVESDIYGICYKLGLYASVGASIDVTDSYYQKLQAKAEKTVGEMENILAFFDGEIAKIPMKERKAIFSCPELEKYQFMKHSLFDDKSIIFDEETQKIINTLTADMYLSTSTYSVLTNSESKNPIITMPDGEEKELTVQLIDEIYNGDYTHDFLVEAFDLHSSRFKGNLSTIALILERYMRDHYALAKLNGFDTVLEYSLSKDGIEPVIFQNNIDSVENLKEDMQRYVTLHKKALGLSEDEKISYAELSIKSADYNASISYDETVAKTKEALAIYGEDYVDGLEEIAKASHIDVYPAETKQSGAYENSTHSKTILPFMFLNFTGYLDDVSTFAHEGGHAMYSKSSNTNEELNALNNEPTIFTHEVASTLNELMLYRYLLDHAQSDEEKLYYLESMIQLIHSTACVQTQYSKFEQYCYSKCESGEGLNPEDISENWANNFVEYYGDDYLDVEGYKYGWSRVPHFLNDPYYVYKYSTSVTYAGIIYEKIQSGDDQIIGQYREMLKLGSSMKPSDLLKTVGIDPTDAAVYSNFAKMFKGLIDEYEELLTSMGKI